MFDWNGNAVQNWVGTNDAGATDAATKSALPENDMVLVSENEYGGASSCSSCCGAKGEIRVAVQYVDDETLRVTEYGYDWRGRRTHTFYDEDAQGDYTYDVACYDNLGRAVKQEKYLLTPNHESPPPGGNNGGGNGYYGGYYENDYYDGHPGNPEPEKTPFATVIAENRMDDDRLLARVERFYDAWNRLVQVGKNIRYEYNELNHRVKKTVENIVAKSFFNKKKGAETGERNR